MPQIDEFHQQNKENITVLAINLGENSGAVREFIEDEGYDFTVLIDHDLSVALAYEIRYTPTTIYIDKEGIISSRQ